MLWKRLTEVLQEKLENLSGPVAIKHTESVARAFPLRKLLAQIKDTYNAQDWIWKEKQGLCTESLEAVQREDPDKQEVSKLPGQNLGRVRMSRLLEPIYKVISVTGTAGCFLLVETDEVILIFMWK